LGPFYQICEAQIPFQQGCRDFAAVKMISQFGFEPDVFTWQVPRVKTRWNRPKGLLVKTCFKWFVVFFMAIFLKMQQHAAMLG